VVREAALEKDLIPLPDFLNSKESIYHKSWTSLPWNAVTWALRQLGLSGAGDDKLPGGQFVVLDNVQAASKAFSDVTADASSRFDTTWSTAHFKKTFANTVLTTQRLSDTDLNVLLKFMSRDKGLVVFDGQVVKIKTPGAESEATTITEEDQAISQLKELTDSLTHQTTLLNKRIDELNDAAKKAVERKNRVAALAALKSKKLAEASLSRRFATLNQLEEVAAKIEEASDQVQFVKAMESSTNALESLNTKVGGADRVGDVVDRLREQMSAADEVGSILAEVAPVLDDGEIDDELAELEKEEKAKEEQAQRQEEDAERAKREAEQEREAERTRARLQRIENIKPGEEEAQPREDAEKSTEAPVGEATKEINKLSLEEEPRAEAQLAS
jgi:charged multivesicular body protein 7